MWYGTTIIVGDFNVTLGYIFADTLQGVHDLYVCLTPAPVGAKCHWSMSMNKYSSADDKACFKFTTIFFVGQLMKKRDLHVTFNWYTAEKENENSAKPLLYWWVQSQ